MSDREYMALALRLAARARGRTSPNPLVGCVIVKNDSVIATGYHRSAGEPHAEIDALGRLSEPAEGATVFVNLEPCCHWGRTPPCTDALIRAGVSRVVAGMIDPNPLVAGRGMGQLEAAGIQVEVGLLEERCRRLNEGFEHFISTGRPFVTLKAATTLDGRVATRTGLSKWITSEASRRKAHRLRSESDVVMVGVGTVLADDPRLTVRSGRLANGQPLRVVVDTHLRTPPEAQICDTSQANTLIYCGPDAPSSHADRLRSKGVSVEVVATSAGRVGLSAVLEDLGRRQIVYVMVEGGSELNGSLVDEGLVDRYAMFVAPKIFGGNGALGFVGGDGVEAPGQAPGMTIREVRRSGPDLFIDAVPLQREQSASLGPQHNTTEE